MNVEELIQHPEHFDRETLYDLRSLLALYPYYQTARILLLQNLYLLHDPSFDEELRRASIYITDRRVIFQMIEAAHYQIHKSIAKKKEEPEKEDRTSSLIDNFLDSMPQEREGEEEKKHHRKPTPADAAVDYVAYLMECEADNETEQTDSNSEKNTDTAEKEKPAGDRTTELIDNFIEDGGFNIHLDDKEPENKEDDSSDNLSREQEYEEFSEKTPEEEQSEEDNSNEGYFTETLARIYIKQGKYNKALEIIQRLNLNYPKKSVYFADQMRFLEKLIINNKNKR